MLEYRMTRRETLVVLTALCGAVALGCDRRYDRPGGYHDLGEVRNLLLKEQHIRERSFLVFRDARGWSAMSTRCTREGCDLTYEGFDNRFQVETLVCACCGAIFDHRGRVVKGPASEPLPYFEITYESRHLYANSNNRVEPSYRFTTPELEQAVIRLTEETSSEEDSQIQVPKALLGSDDEQPPVVTEDPTPPAGTETPAAETPEANPANGTVTESSTTSTTE